MGVFLSVQEEFHCDSCQDEIEEYGVCSLCYGLICRDCFDGDNSICFDCQDDYY